MSYISNSQTSCTTINPNTNKYCCYIFNITGVHFSIPNKYHLYHLISTKHATCWPCDCHINACWWWFGSKLIVAYNINADMLQMLPQNTWWSDHKRGKHFNMCTECVPVACQRQLLWWATWYKTIMLQNYYYRWIKLFYTQWC